MAEQNNNSSMNRTPEIAYDFDADAYMKANGLTFQNVNPNGTANVITSAGEEAIFDPKEALRSMGYQAHPSLDVSYNNKDEAVNDGVVGLGDRFKMSFGNEKGNLKYLKNKYGEADLDSAGNLVVRDKGVWKKVDLEGMSDKDGWSLSETIADALDLGGDVTMGAAALAATAGTVATGGAVGAVLAAGAAGGAGGSLLSKGVLGQFFGTYDNDASGLVKDMMIDGLVGLAGEAIPIGGRALVAPTFKKAMSTLSKTADGTQAMVAKFMSSIDPNMPEGVARHMMTQGDAVTAALKSATEEARERVIKAGAQGDHLSFMNTELPAILNERTSQAGKAVVERVQKDASTHYENAALKIFKEDIAPNIKEMHQGAKQYGNDLVNSIDTFFNEEGLLQVTKTSNTTSIVDSVTESSAETQAKRTVTGTTKSFSDTLTELETTASRQSSNRVSRETVKETLEVTPEALAQWAKEKGVLGTSPAHMKEMAESLNSMRNFALKVQKDGIASPKDLNQLMRMTTEMDKLLEKIPQAQRDLFKGRFQAVSDGMDTIIQNIIPKKARAGFKSLSGNYRNVKSQFRALGMENPSLSLTQMGDMFNQHYFAFNRGGNSSDAASQSIINAIREVASKETLQAMDNVGMNMAVQALSGTSIMAANTAQSLRDRAIVGIGRAFTKPIAIGMAKLQRKASSQAFLRSEKGQQALKAFGLLRTPGLLNNADLLGAGMTGILQTLDMPERLKGEK